MLSNLVSNKKKIVVAMSGGVDSSTVAAMLHQEGHEVIGITMQLYDHGMAVQKKGACCAGQDIYDAKMVASKLGIPHYVLDYESHFKQTVIDDFVDSYMRGETPLPCVRCNQNVKFHDLLKMSQELGADALATGHYVKKVLNNERAELHKAHDQDKDQSYFLFATTINQLNYLMFPLGNFTKKQTRALALKYNLLTADKPDSQDICFVPNGNYRDVVTKMRPGSKVKGRFMHVDGYDMGEHEGIINYTIGQRRGIGISHKEPLYVIRIDTKSNVVYLGSKSALSKIQFVIKDVNWLAHDLFPDQVDVYVKIRSTMVGVEAMLNKISDSQLLVTLTAPEEAVTPGQACVIYRGTRVLGGGWITHDIK